MTNHSNANSDAKARLQRSRYFPRKLVTAADLTQDQVYFRQLWRLHNRVMYGSGVVCGLEVLPGDPVPDEVGGRQIPTVIVTQGYALSPQGDGILVPTDQEPMKIPVPEFDACQEPDVEPAGRLYYLSIRYQDEELAPVRSERCAPVTTCEFGRIQAGFEIRALEQCPSTDPPLDLEDPIAREEAIAALIHGRFISPRNAADAPELFACPGEMDELLNDSLDVSDWVILARLHLAADRRLLDIDYLERTQIISPRILQTLFIKQLNEQYEEELP